MGGRKSEVRFGLGDEERLAGRAIGARLGNRPSTIVTSGSGSIDRDDQLEDRDVQVQELAGEHAADRRRGEASQVLLVDRHPSGP